MKKLFFLLFLLPLLAAAQKTKTHTVGPKESLTSIGRLYNINGRELANYNKIDYDKGLTLGQVLKIPETNAPAAVVNTPPVKIETPAKIPPPVKTVVVSNKSGTPIYHTVGKKETLYHISTLYNKVPINDIKKWNNLIGDALNEGAKLIVGYTTEKIVLPTKAPQKPVKQIAEVVKPKKDESPRIKTPGEDEINAAAKTAKKEVVQTDKKSEVVTAPVNMTAAADFKGGAFKNVFEEQIRGKELARETGIGGVFKSTSGWQDGKYYCLHNTAAAGTILKITNNATGKSVYAKVLDLIPDIKQNTGLLIRISNAAADALGTGENKLDCTINYSK